MAKKFRIINAVLLTCASVLVAANSILLVKSLNWPYILDAPFLHYIAWQITQGAVPYRDFFDMNLPGTYMLHLAVIKFLGTSNLAFRVFDIGCLLIIASFTIAFCKKFGWLNAVLAAALFSAFHLFNGNLYCGQRDYLTLVFIICALYFFMRYHDFDHSRIPLFCSGFLLGVGISIKPFTALWIAPMIAVIIMKPVLATRKKTADSFLLVLSATVPAATLFAWLYIIGGLQDFFEMYVSYAPLYAKAPISFGFSVLFKPFLGVPLLWLAMAVSSIAVFRIRETGEHDIRRIFSLFGIAFGLFTFFAQDKGHFYHLYPTFFFIFLTATTFLGNLYHKKNILNQMLTAIVIYLAAGLAYYSVKHIFVPPWQFITQPQHIVHLEKDLEGRLAPPDMIQFFEPDAAGTLIMLKLHLTQPSRMLSDGYLYYKIDHPFTRQLRQELMHDLMRSPPLFVVISKLGWPVDGYERLETFPALAAWISANYVLDIERPWYRIYKRIEYH